LQDGKKLPESKIIQSVDLYEQMGTLFRICEQQQQRFDSLQAEVRQNLGKSSFQAAIADAESD